VILVCGSCTEREKASVDTATGVVGPQGRGRERAEAETKALSTDAAFAGGPARSSREAVARWGGGGAKGPAHQECPIDQPGRMALGGSEMNNPKPKDKSFAISKQLVWEAWRQVRANKGAPGVDGQALEEFEADLEDNLYVIWNRMSSGSYFPPPVRAVVIPKPHGQWGPNVRCAHDRGPGSSDDRGHVLAGAGGAEVPPGLLDE
jgi:hypothetical protein